jgi:subtilase family serine protease
MTIDLTGSFFNIVQQKIREGQALNLDFSVINNGNEDILTPFSFDIFISRDERIGSGDFKLGTYEIKNGLKAGEDTGLKSYRYAAPPVNHPFWLDGNHTYTVGIRIDTQNKIFESNETNNRNQGKFIDSDQVEVLDFGNSDLRASLTRCSKQQITPGGKVDLSFVVENESEAIANPFSIDIYLSADENISAAEDVKLGTYDIRTIIEAGGDTGLKRYSYKTPALGNGIWEKGDGKYYIGLDIDSKNEVSETNENNNSNQGLGFDNSDFDVTGLNSAADVVVTSFKAPENFKVGDTITVEYELSNQGGTKADLFAAGFYLFTKDYLANNSNLSIEDVPEVFFLQGDRNSSLISLNAGESTGKMTTQLTIPQQWAGFSGTGDYYLGVEADPYDDVVESSDANNSLTGEMKDYQKVRLDAPVDNTLDLVGTHFDIVQDQVIPGQEFDLAFTIANQGLASADTFEFDLYLSADANISADEDYYLGSYRIPDSLAGKSDSGIRSSRYQAPAADHPFWSKGDGQYFAGMIIDPKNDIVETNETNNSNQGLNLDAVETNVIGLNAIADLKTSGKFDVKADTLKTGATCEVQYQIANDGTAPANLFAAGFYIFTEDYLTNHDNLSIEDVPEVYFLQGDRASSLISLEPGANTGVMTTQLTLPTNWEGFNTSNSEYYIGVAADPYGDILESDELNNSLNGALIDYEQVTINVI